MREGVRRCWRRGGNHTVLFVVELPDTGLYYIFLPYITHVRYFCTQHRIKHIERKINVCLFLTKTA